MDEEQSQFIADAREMVEKLDRDLEQLRAVHAHGPKRRELAARIFRRVHTLKGSAGRLRPSTASELSTTRRMLERCPDAKVDWRPHAKSRTLGELATHLAQLPGFGLMMMTPPPVPVLP